MRPGLVAMALFLIIMVSGCVSDTGELSVKFTETNATGGDGTSGNDSIDHSDELAGPPVGEGLTNETRNESQAAGTGGGAVEKLSENGLEEEQEQDPCSGVVCYESVATCPDGEIMSCENACDPATGNCSSCLPDCEGHEEECMLDCGECEALDDEACECVILLYCEGNGICEPSSDEDNEWPDGEDCVEFDACDDGDECTLDVFDPNNQECMHEATCCDDGDDCTLDEYDYAARECVYTYLCCGNGVCEPGNGETQESCPEDCIGEGNESGDVEIADVDYAGEVVALEGYGIDMSGWTIEDAKSHVYVFPDGFVIGGTTYLHTNGNEEDNNDTDLFWGRSDSVWNDDGDVATLKDSLGETVDIFEY